MWGLHLQPQTNEIKGPHKIVPMKVKFTFQSAIHKENPKPVDETHLLKSDFIERENKMVMCQEDLYFMQIVE